MDAPTDYEWKKVLRELNRLNMDPSKKKYDWEKDLRARELKGQEWEAYKGDIKTLYLTDGITLKELRRLMYERHGFYATYVYPDSGCIPRSMICSNIS
jgi:hypothetical protein